jgi:hypothetical protein
VVVQELTGRKVRYGTWLRARPAGPSDGAVPRWVGMPLRVVRGQDRNTVDQRNDLAYDGLLIADRDLPRGERQCTLAVGSTKSYSS